MYIYIYMYDQLYIKQLRNKKFEREQGRYMEIFAVVLNISNSATL